MLVLACMTASGCRQHPTEPTRQEPILIFAASSLREAFMQIATVYRQRHPNAEPTFHFAGSQELRLQLEHGANADVFASADLPQINALSRAQQVRGVRVFAQNEPVLIVSSDQAASVQTFGDLRTVSRVVVGAPQVPIGRYTEQILDRASAVYGADFRSVVEGHVLSRELNVRHVLAKVTLGEAQAGIVYQSDARTASPNTVRVLRIPREINVIAEYPIGIVSGSTHQALAQQWIDTVLSPEGQRILQQAGFLTAAPPATEPSAVP